jgi:hypothetical protein
MSKETQFGAAAKISRLNLKEQKISRINVSKNKSPPKQN